MRVVTSDENWSSLPIVDIKYDDGEKIVSFEDKSSVLGSKFCVYNKEDKQIYFLDEEVVNEFDSFNIQQNAETIASLTRSNKLVHREIKIETNQDVYSFLILHGFLYKNKEKVAKLIRRPDNILIKAELYQEEDHEYLVTLLYVIKLLLSR